MEKTKKDLIGYNLNQATYTALLKFNHPLVEAIENQGVDKGRFLAYLIRGCDWCIDPQQPRNTESFGSLKEFKKALKRVKKG